MKTNYRLWIGPLLVAVLTLAFGSTTYAAETPREELVHAYRLMKTANHDYAGHRDKAMQQVQVAGKALGLELGGDLDAKEHQWKSDEQMTEARRLLKEARDKMERRDRDKIADHLEGAVRELDLALKAK